MAKQPASKTPEPAAEALPANVEVRLKCTYSGFPGDPGPGDVIEIDPVEANRLVSLGAAEFIGQAS